jgi:transposase
MESTLEVLKGRKSGREVHRHWPDEVKAQIVSERPRLGVMVNEVAEHGLKRNHLSNWRAMARHGKLVLPAPGDAVEFAAVIVESPVSEPPIKIFGRPEIIHWRSHDPSGKRRVRRRIAAVARACAVPAIAHH